MGFPELFEPEEPEPDDPVPEPEPDDPELDPKPPDPELPEPKPPDPKLPEPELPDPKLLDPKLPAPKLLVPELDPGPLLPLDCPVTAFWPKLLAEVDETPPPVILTPLLSVSIRGSYQNSQVS